MAQPYFSASAPGSLILMGEYAVLAGYPCLVLAINQTITVTITPNSSTELRVESSVGNYTSDINHITIEPPLEYVLTALTHYSPLPSGAHISIQSEIKPTLGLGSSAAVTIALLQALSTWTKKKISPEELFKAGLAVIHQVQGKGSGADLAASIYGGALSFKASPFIIKQLTPRPAITVVYSGHKTTTTQALHNLSDKMQTETHYLNEVFASLGTLATQSIDAFNQQDWTTLGSLMNSAQKTLKAFGVSTDKIDEITQTLTANPSIYGAKLSGSGLGDCVIALGELTENPFGTALLPLHIQTQGVSNVN